VRERISSGGEAWHGYAKKKQTTAKAMKALGIG
jgi:hypothetical protein